MVTFFPFGSLDSLPVTMLPVIPCPPSILGLANKNQTVLIWLELIPLSHLWHVFNSRFFSNHVGGPKLSSLPQLSCFNPPSTPTPHPTTPCSPLPPALRQQFSFVGQGDCATGGRLGLGVLEGDRKGPACNAPASDGWLGEPRTYLHEKSGQIQTE